MTTPNSHRSLRIAIPLAGFNLSGGVKSLIGVANALAERGHRVRLLVPDHAASPPAPLRPGVTLRVLWTGPSWLPASLRKLVHLFQLGTTGTAGADVCLANYYPTAYAAWLSHLIRGDRAALAYNVRGYEPLSHGLLAPAPLPSRLARFALAWLSYRLPIQKICTTDWLREQIGDPSAYVVGHGIDLEIFRRPAGGPRRDQLVVGTIGRRGEGKGYPDFLRAVELLPAELPIRIRLAAPDPVQPPCRFPADVTHPADELSMAEFYGMCDVFVFPSRVEGFGLPALEAMACGVVVVTTDCGGVRAFARPDENCLMVPAADAPALAAAITRLARDAALRERLLPGGLQTASQFGRQAVQERFCDYLEQLAEQVRPSDDGRDRRSR